MYKKDIKIIDELIYKFQCVGEYCVKQLNCIIDYFRKRCK